MKNLFVIYGIGFVIFLHFIHVSESLKNVPSKSAPPPSAAAGTSAAAVTGRHITSGSDNQQTNPINVGQISHSHNNLNIVPNGRQLRYRTRSGPPPSSAHHHRYRIHSHNNRIGASGTRLKPVIMRRYQVNNGANAGVHIINNNHHAHHQNLIKYPQKMYAQLSPNYQMKKQRLTPSNNNNQQHLSNINHKIQQKPPYHSHKYSQLSSQFNNGPFNSYQINSNGNGNIFKKTHHGLQSSPVVAAAGPASTINNPKNFHASAQFHNGQLDFTDPNYYHRRQYQQHPQHPHKLPNKSTYSVYDHSNSDDNHNYLIQKPIQYPVALNNHNQNYNHNDHNSILDPIKLAQQTEEAKKYLNFMSSSDYFLPKPQPDYHLLSDYQVNPSQLNDNSDNIQKTQLSFHNDYMNVRENLEFGNGASASATITDSTVNAGNQHHQTPDNTKNLNHKILDRYDPEKIEFTENDAIHSSYTSNPHDNSAKIINLKSNYGSSKRYKASLRSDRIQKKHNNNEQQSDEKWSAQIPELNKRHDSYGTHLSDEQISKECAQKCFNDDDLKFTQMSSTDGSSSSNNNNQNDNEENNNEDMQFGYNEHEVECYESCISAYKSSN